MSYVTFHSSYLYSDGVHRWVMLGLSFDMFKGVMMVDSWGFDDASPKPVESVCMLDRPDATRGLFFHQ